MLNYWWVTRPKRKLDSVQDILSCFAEASLNCEWQGNIYTHLAFEEALERHGLKKPGERKDQRGGGGRTYYAWLSSLGLVYKEVSSGQSKLTEAGQAIVAGRNAEYVLSRQVLNYQFPSPFSRSVHSAKTRLDNRFQIRPFRFLLKLLTDERLSYKLSLEEIARVIVVAAENESEKTYNSVVKQILQYRENGIASLPDDFFERYSPSSGTVNIEHPYSHLDDLANTLINWLDYTKYINRPGGKWISIQSLKMDEVKRILSDGTKLIENADDQERFQKEYGSLHAR